MFFCWKHIKTFVFLIIWHQFYQLMTFFFFFFYIKTVYILVGAKIPQPVILGPHPLLGAKKVREKNIFFAENT